MMKESLLLFELLERRVDLERRAKLEAERVHHIRQLLLLQCAQHLAIGLVFAEVIHHLVVNSAHPRAHLVDLILRLGVEKRRTVQ